LQRHIIPPTEALPFHESLTVWLLFVAFHAQLSANTVSNPRNDLAEEIEAILTCL